MEDQAKGLRELVLRSHTNNSRPAHKARVITVTSGKGGVGKSNITVNLALALAQMGVRTVIFDADLGLANVDILLGLMPNYDMHHVIRGDKKLAEIIVEGPLGVRIIPGSTGLLEMTEMSNFQRQQLLEQLAELETDTDIIFIDTGAGISKAVLSFITSADEVLMVTNTEPTSITDAYSVIKLMKSYGLQIKTNLLVNQVATLQEGQNAADRFSLVTQTYLNLKTDYIGCVIDDKLVGRAVKNQKPFLLSYPGSKAAGCIKQIAKKLIVPETADAPPVGGLQRFMRKISSIFGNEV